MIVSQQRGHMIEFNHATKKWVYQDNGEPIQFERPCRKCGRYPTEEGYDACLGYIPGVDSACCGHGIPKNGVLKPNEEEE